MEATQGHALLPQSPYKKRSLKPYHVKYYGVIFVVFMMIAAVQIFVNYATIQTSIASVTREREEIIRHTAYLSLQSFVYTLPESKVFMAHDNSILLQNERIMSNIKIIPINQTWSAQSTGEVITTWNNTTITKPWKSWVLYFADKMSK